MYLLFLSLAACHGTDDTGADSTPLNEQTDVLVVGAGPAGLAAAVSARAAGAEVTVLDLSETAGDGVVYATRLFGAGTAMQSALGISDSPEAAAAEWASITGVDGDTPSVSAYLDATSETLDWLVDLGFEVANVGPDGDAGETARMHQVYGEGARDALLAACDCTLRLRVQVDSLTVEEGRVTGVRWTDLASGESGATGAGAVVVTTGGYLRDRARVDAYRPALAGRRLLYETNPHAGGSGLDLLDGVGAVTDGPENMGIYVHAIQDPDQAEGEAMVLTALDDQLFVDETGQRFADEGRSRSFDFFDMLPEGEVFALIPEANAEQISAFRPPYNAADPAVTEDYPLTDLPTVSEEVFVDASLEALGAAAGFDGAGAAATVAQVDALIAAGETDEFGRSFAGLPPFEDGLWWAVRLTPGLAKGFGGVATDLDTHPLDANGDPIPGLYVAGELAGMIPGGGAGLGFAGSVSACYYGGRIAGVEAAAEAQAP